MVYAPCELCVSALCWCALEPIHIECGAAGSRSSGAIVVSGAGSRPTVCRDAICRAGCICSLHVPAMMFPRVDVAIADCDFLVLE